MSGQEEVPPSAGEVPAADADKAEAGAGAVVDAGGSEGQEGTTNARDEPVLESWADRRAGLRPPGADATKEALTAYLEQLKDDCTGLAAANGRGKGTQAALPFPHGGRVNDTEVLDGPEARRALMDMCERISGRILELDARKLEVEALAKDVTRLRHRKQKIEDVLREKLEEYEQIECGNNVTAARIEEAERLHDAAVTEDATPEDLQAALTHYIHALRVKVRTLQPLTHHTPPPLRALTPAQADALQAWLAKPTPMHAMLCSGCTGALDRLSRPPPPGGAARGTPFDQHASANEYWYAPVHDKFHRRRTAGYAYLPGH